MKIIYDYQIFNQQKYGGISRYICEIASRIAKLEEFDVSILAYSYVNKHLESVNPNLVIGFQRQHIPKTTLLIDKINSGLSKIYLKYHKPNIVHETYYSSKRIAPKDSKTVLTVYDMVHEKFNFILNKKFDRHISKAKVTAIKHADHIICISHSTAIKHADHIICISHSTKKDLLEILDVNPDKVSVIYLGCSFPMENEINLESKSIAKPYILYVGQRAGYKNFERLLQAYASNKNLQNDFNLICFGANPFSAHELDLMRKLGLTEEKVTHISTDEKALPKLYWQASVFVYPSLYEGFGLPLLEAMSCNCPVICSNTSSLPEVAGEAANFFDPYDVDSITDALEKVLYSSERKKKLIELGQERVKLFSWEASAQQHTLIYKSLR